MYPEHEKLKALNGANQTVGDFIEWLGEQGLVIAKWSDDGGDYMWPAGKSRDELIAEFFDIDRDKLEEEKREMLNKIRESNDVNSS